MIQLGDRVRDRLTGYEGIAVARYSYLTGCDRIAIAGEVNEQGKVPDWHTQDEPLVDKIGATPFSDMKAPVTGGPRPDPPRR